ncbi:hypothetical protein B0H17DRAFT_1155259 [Mycena rosella]|uniref:Uncharacterized protein n=1 Tax=Mycena rosella TaxID=1033263 RepID=A0AAD7F7M6_MYCRO|nr:hypothetical protein B0H17DRAFT_1155259 [Mycena rosella]
MLFATTSTGGHFVTAEVEKRSKKGFNGQIDDSGPSRTVTFRRTIDVRGSRSGCETIRHRFQRMDEYGGGMQRNWEVRTGWRQARGPKDKDMPYGVEGGGLLPGVRKTAWEHPTSNSGRVTWGPVIQVQTSDGKHAIFILQDLTPTELKSLVHRAFIPFSPGCSPVAGRQAYIGSAAHEFTGAIMMLRMGMDRLEEIFGSARILIAHAAEAESKD